MIRKSLQTQLSKEILEYEYNECGSMQKVATKLNVSVDTIYKYMKLYLIPYYKSYKSIYQCIDNFFELDSEESYYWAGFIAADGSLHERKYSKVLKISLSLIDILHIEKFKNSIKSNHPIGIYDVKPSKIVNSSKCAELQIVSNRIFDNLSKFNIIPNKTKIYDMPKWLIDHALINHFMRGYFDGDGCISSCGLGPNRVIKQGVWSILGTQNFIQNYKNILLKYSDLNDVKISKHGSVYKLSYSGNLNMHKIYNFLYANSTIYLDRKRLKFNEYFIVQ